MGDILVLCYHAVSERWPSRLAVTPTELERQLELLLRRGYRGVTFKEAVVASPAAEKILAVTYDDAYRSVAELAAPILSRLGLPATVFVPTAFPGADAPLAWPGVRCWLGGPYETELTPMSWAELATLAAAGWEIGSHTRTHPRLTHLNDDALAEELEGSRRDCEAALGMPCKSLAYPYGDIGDFDQRVVAAAGEAGYAAAATLPLSVLHSPSMLSWPRFAVDGRESHSAFRRKISRVDRRIRSGRGWAAGMATRRRLRLRRRLLA